jgi:YNFM family putative membrane transporter
LAAGEKIRHDTPAFRRANLGLFAAGVATFGLLYCVQPLLPEFSRHFGVGAAESALALSLPCAVMAVAMLFAAPVSDALGRKSVIAWSLALSTLIVLCSAAAPSWSRFLQLRALLGLALSGVPAVAMAYLTEEVHADSIGLGMGLYIGGNAAGGLGGRLIASVLTEYFGWRIGVAAVGAIGGVAGCVFVRCLPASRHFAARPLRMAAWLQGFASLFRDQGLPWLFAAGFVLLGCLVTVYNYAGYRLMAPPYRMSQAAVGMIFNMYLLGIVSSSWIGHLAGRLGRRKVLWTMFVIMFAGICLTIFRPVWLIAAGIGVMTFGFFGGHSIASSWVGRRAGGTKAQASSTYLFAYYMGSSAAGPVGGLFYARFGWNGVAAFMAALVAAGLLIAWRLYHVPPLPSPPGMVESPLP